MAAKATAEATMTAAAALAAKRFADDVHDDDEADEELVNRLTEEAELASEAARRARAAESELVEGMATASSTGALGMATGAPGDTDLLMGRKEAGNGLLAHAEKSTDAGEREMLLTKADASVADSYTDLLDGYGNVWNSSSATSTSIGREVSLLLINTDLPRTFPQLRLFDQEGPYYK